MSNRRKLRGKDWEPLSRRIRTITDGHEDELRAAVDAAAPGFLDQMAAATADSARAHAEFLHAMRNREPGRYHEADARRAPPRLLDQVTGLYLRVMSEVATGERTHCGHISLTAPRPAIACVHDNWIYCRPCAGRRASRPVLTEREEHTCDLCGSYRPGQTMHALYPHVGPVMLIVGICDGCRDQLVEADQ